MKTVKAQDCVQNQGADATVVSDLDSRRDTVDAPSFRLCPHRLTVHLRRARHLAGLLDGGDLSPFFLYDVAIQSLADRVALIGRPLRTILIVGCGLGDALLRDAIRSVLGTSVAIHVARPFFDGEEGGGEGSLVWSANGLIDVPPGMYDLVISFFPWPLVQDPLIMGRCAYEALKAGHPFLGVLFGGDTLSALRDALYRVDLATHGGAYGRIHPMVSPSGVFHVLTAAGFDTPVVDVDKLKAHYPHVRGLVRDLRVHGMGCALQGAGQNPGGGAFWRAVEAQLKDQGDATPSHGITMGYDVIYFSAWRP